MSALVHRKRLDWTHNIDLTEVDLLWSGGHGCYGATTLVAVDTPFGPALVEVVGTDHPTDGEHVRVRAALSSSVTGTDVSSEAPWIRRVIEAARRFSVPILVEERDARRLVYRLVDTESCVGDR